MPKRSVQEKAAVHAILDEVRLQLRFALRTKQARAPAEPSSHFFGKEPLHDATTASNRALSDWHSRRWSTCGTPANDPQHTCSQGLICHVAFAVDGQQFCVPTCYARVGETLYLHGSAVSRMLKTLAVGAGLGRVLCLLLAGFGLRFWCSTQYNRWTQVLDADRQLQQEP